MTETPQFMPILSHGQHLEAEDGACIMEYVSILAGETFSDSPTCTNKMLQTIAIEINDNLEDEQRQRLLPFIPRLINTNVDLDIEQIAEFLFWVADQKPDLPGQDTAGKLYIETKRRFLAAGVAAYRNGNDFFCLGGTWYSIPAEIHPHAMASLSSWVVNDLCKKVLMDLDIKLDGADAVTYTNPSYQDEVADYLIEYFSNAIDKFEEIVGRKSETQLTTEQLNLMIETTLPEGVKDVLDA